MIKIKNFAKNSLNSFILVPLLFSNMTAPELFDNNKRTIPEVMESFGLTFKKSIHDENVVKEEAPDPRAAKIDAYFAQWDLPLTGHGKGMIAAADKYGIDWRLLPALAMLETTGGKNLCDYNQNMNAFGYGSCQIHFKTFEESFEAVAKTLSGNGSKTSHLYKGKSLEGILEVYNPPATPGIMKNYHGKAFKVMNDIESMQIDSTHLAKA